MMYLGDFDASDVVRFMWNSADSNGASITRSTDGTISVYKDGGVTQSTTGVTGTEDFDGLTGVHLVAVDTSADGTFYSVGSDFAVVLSAATIDTRTVNAVLAHFSIRNRAALYPTTAGRTLDVDASGGAEVGSFQAGAITAAAIADGAIDAATFAAGAITATVIATGAIDADALAADTITAAKIAADVSAEIADAVWDEDATGHQTGGTFGQAIGDPAADTNTIYGAVVTGAAGATVAADIIAVKAETAAILDDTDLIDDATSGLAKIATDVAAVLVDTGTTLQAEVDGIQADTEDIQTRLPAALVGGRIDASVGAMAANTLTAAALAADAGAEIADAVLDRNMATGTDSGSPTVRTPRQALRALRNKAGIAGGTLTVTKEDDTTTSWTAAVTTAAGDPISEIDPADA